MSHIYFTRFFKTGIHPIMSNTLPFIRDRSILYTISVFLTTKEIIFLNNIYRGVNILVLKPKKSRTYLQLILLNLNDLMTFQFIEWSIFEISVRKRELMSYSIIQQLNKISPHFKNNKTTSIEEKWEFIKDVNNEIILQHISKTNQSFFNKLNFLKIDKLLNARQLWNNIYLK